MLAPLQRTDYEARNPIQGPFHVGSIIIRPDNDSSPYVAQLMRYGYDGIPGQGSGDFSFAFLLTPGEGLSTPLYLPIRSSIDGVFPIQNYLEVLNSSPHAAEIEILLRSNTGERIGSSVLSTELGAYAQEHFDMSGLLNDHGLVQGVAEIRSSVEDSIVAESMFYFRDSTHGRMLSMFGSQARYPSPADQPSVISWNRFLGMLNYITIINPTTNAVDFDLGVWNRETGLTDTRVSLPAFGSMTQTLAQEGFGTKANSYGTVVVPGGLLAELLRVGVYSSTAQTDEVDFVNLI